MLFNVIKDLKNKVFTLDIKRQYIKDDAENIKEAQLEDDFGLVEVEVGGLFEGYVNKVEEKYVVTLERTGGEGEVSLKFSLPANTVKLSKEAVISYSCDAAKEAASGEIPALKVAELKSDLFALEIKKRIEKSVDDWKKQATDFETKDPT